MPEEPDHRQCECQDHTALHWLQAKPIWPATLTGAAHKRWLPSTAGYASLNVPNSSTAPSTPAVGDVWLNTADIHLQFQDKNNVVHRLMFFDDLIQNVTAKQLDDGDPWNRNRHSRQPSRPWRYRHPEQHRCAELQWT